ncbi:ABC transporter substrate-binding protein [Nocardia rhizosphaerihabitans]|uniref:ABC transporter substrate-binding protein n=1 Tax=Nocardia rhizosphaerihabitans TaxID=1691570 RepID=UPI0036706002
MRANTWCLGSRRLAGSMALAAALMASATACGGGGGGHSVADLAANLVTTTPPAAGDVGTVNWALPQGEPVSLDPVRAGNYSSNTIVPNMCESLLTLNPDFSVKPGIAESYTQPDPLTLVFNIRPGVKFWNGSTVTAADVAYSLQRNTDPKNTPVGADLFRAVSAISETGPLQVTVKFARHDAQFLNNMAGPAAAVSEKAFVERVGPEYGTPQHGVMCTGPFKFGRWVPGDRIVLTRNDGYWGDKAHAAEFDFVFFTDDSTLSSALAAGQIDGTYEVPIGSLGMLRGSSTGTVYFGPSTQSLSIGPVSPSGPAADPRIRTALDLAVDKKALINSVLRGAGTPLKTFTPPLLWAGDPAKAVYDAAYAELPDTSVADIDKAKALVEQAAPASRNLTMAIPSGDQLGLQTATLVKSDAERIGLNIDIKQLQPTEFGELFYNPGKREGLDLIVTTGYIEVPGVYYYPPAFVMPDGPFNWTRWNNPEAAALLAEGQQSGDRQDAAQKFVASQRIFAPAKLQITLAGLAERLYMNKRITGAPASFAYISSPWAASVGSAQ